MPSASTAFELLTETVLRRLQFQICLIYLVFGKTFEEMNIFAKSLIDLKQLFEKSNFWVLLCQLKVSKKAKTKAVEY